MKRFSISPFSLLDPDVNEAWGKRILAEEIARHGLNWKAVGKYHSPDPEHAQIRASASNAGLTDL